MINMKEFVIPTPVHHNKKMDTPGRRVRRDRQRRLFTSLPSIASVPTFGGMTLHYSIVALCLVITMMQCLYSYSRPSRQELSELVRNMDDIAKQLNEINNDYQILENKLSEYSEDLPKLENQLIALETLAQTMQESPTNWKYPSQASVPYIEASLNNFNKTIQENPVQNNNHVLKNCPNPLRQCV